LHSAALLNLHLILTILLFDLLLELFHLINLLTSLLRPTLLLARRRLLLGRLLCLTLNFDLGLALAGCLRLVRLVTTGSGSGSCGQRLAGLDLLNVILVLLIEAIEELLA
jgi:hypothetical protein